METQSMTLHIVGVIQNSFFDLFELADEIGLEKGKLRLAKDSLMDFLYF